MAFGCVRGDVLRDVVWSKYSSATGDAPLSCSFNMQDKTWARLLAYVTGLVNRRLLLQCEYLIAENRILRSHVSGKPRLWDPERCTLAGIGKRFGRKYLAEVAYVAKPETILTWYRRLIARKFDGPKQRAYAERPRVDAAVEALIVRMAQENAG